MEWRGTVFISCLGVCMAEYEKQLDRVQQLGGLNPSYQFKEDWLGD